MFDLVLLAFVECRRAGRIITPSSVLACISQGASRGC